jgi:DNA-binding response OmpR family regulator
MPPHKILVVDDNPLVVELLTINLTAAGYQVFTALDGQAALQQAKQVLPDLIILDIMLPVMNGYDICYRLRKSGPQVLTPIIFLSAKNQMVDKITGLQLGADDYITKPFNMEELLIKVGSLLKRTAQIL